MWQVGGLRAKPHPTAHPTHMLIAPQVLNNQINANIKKALNVSSKRWDIWFL